MHSMRSQSVGALGKVGALDRLASISKMLALLGLLHGVGDVVGAGPPAPATAAGIAEDRVGRKHAT